MRKLLISLVMLFTLVMGSMTGYAQSIETNNNKTDRQSSEIQSTGSVGEPITIQPQESFSMTLVYLDYGWLWNTFTSAWRVQWGFDGSSIFVGIELWVFDAANFALWDSGKTATGSKLSDGSKYSAKGTYDIPYSDTWYFVFYNRDPDRLTTTLSIKTDERVDASWGRVTYQLLDTDADLIEDTVRYTADPDLPSGVTGDVAMVFELWRNNGLLNDVRISSTSFSESVTGTNNDAFIYDITVSTRITANMYIVAGVRYVPVKESYICFEWCPDVTSTSTTFNIAPLGHGFPMISSFTGDLYDTDSDGYYDSLTAVVMPSMGSDVTASVTVITDLVKKGPSDVVVDTKTNSYSLDGSSLSALEINMGAVPSTGEYYLKGQIYLSLSTAVKDSAQTVSGQLYVIGFGAGTWYIDWDGDGYGDENSAGQSSVSQPSGYVSDNTDCDDRLSSVYPGAVEIADGLDNNCDGQIDEGLTTTSDDVTSTTTTSDDVTTTTTISSTEIINSISSTTNEEQSTPNDQSTSENNDGSDKTSNDGNGRDSVVESPNDPLPFSSYLVFTLALMISTKLKKRR